MALRDEASMKRVGIGALLEPFPVQDLRAGSQDSPP